MLRRTIALIEAVRKCLGVCRQITAHNKIYVSGPILVKLAYAFNVNIYDYDWLSPNLVEKKQLQIEHMDYSLKRPPSSCGLMARFFHPSHCIYIHCEIAFFLFFGLIKVI